jgi:hypothetical protein
MGGGLIKCLIAAAIVAGLLTATAYGGDPTATASGRKTYAKFSGHRVYKPSTLGFGAHELITGITWSKWGKKLAIGHGTYQVNDCIPDCATGTITPTPSTIYLTGRIRCGGHFIFNRLKVFFNGHRRTSPAFCKQ